MDLSLGTVVENFAALIGSNLPLSGGQIKEIGESPLAVADFMGHESWADVDFSVQRGDKAGSAFLKGCSIAFHISPTESLDPAKLAGIELVRLTTGNLNELLNRYVKAARTQEGKGKLPRLVGAGLFELIRIVGMPMVPPTFTRPVAKRDGKTVGPAVVLLGTGFFKGPSTRPRFRVVQFVSPHNLETREVRLDTELPLHSCFALWPA